MLLINQLQQKIPAPAQQHARLLHNDQRNLKPPPRLTTTPPQPEVSAKEISFRKTNK